MTRWLLLAALGLSAAACSPDDDDHHHGGKRRVAPDCSQNLTCGACTPVIGCGWCSFADGSGRCARGPSACGDTFRWNWEPSDCPATPALDAGPVDAVEETAATDAEADAAEAAVDAPSETPSECVAPSSFPAGCSRTTGGTLCAAGQYTVGCHDTGKPTGCAAALTSGGSTYYCCPCD